MKVIVGLGNPGKRYADTPHNGGFAVVDALAETWNCRLRRSFRFGARCGKARGNGEPVLLVKPETYMNNSGQAVGGLLRYHKAPPSDLVVVLDDADLPLGRLRVRACGSSGGHRGLASVIGHVGGEAFARVRIGIGRRGQEEDLVRHVLSAFSARDRPRADRAVDMAAEAVQCVLEHGVEAAMNRFNGIDIE